jgi:dihydrofolate reductase
MKLTAIMAISDDNVIGVDGPNGPTLPWRLPPDLKRFKELTTGHAVIMGRKTHDSIGRYLPNRWNVIVSRDSRASAMDQKGGWVWTIDPKNALEWARQYDPEPFVIGGAEIWMALWPHVTHVELTRVHTTVGKGTWFDFDPREWKVSHQTPERTSGPHDYEGLGYTFCSLERA